MGWPCGVGAFIGMWLGFGAFDKFFWLFAGIFAWSTAVGLACTFVTLRRYRCPQCNARIRETSPPLLNEGDPVRYHCQRCDIMWETGFNKPSAD